MTRIALIVATFGLVVGACGSADGDGVATLSDTGDASPTDTVAPVEGAATDEETLMAFAACMRDNGVTEFEDPTINADGSVDFSFRGGRGGDGEEPFGGVDRETVEAAFAVCSEDLEGLAFGPGGGEFDASEFEDRFVEFAACMRDNGVEMDDPDFSSFGPGQRGGGGGPFASLDLDDPTVQAALDECQEMFADFTPRIARGGERGSEG